MEVTLMQVLGILFFYAGIIFVMGTIINYALIFMMKRARKEKNK